MDLVLFFPKRQQMLLSPRDYQVDAQRYPAPYPYAIKFVLDQYIMQGGKTLWLLDNVHAEMDSLMLSGKSLAFNRDLNLTDMLFNYGVRINYNITKDLYSGSIRLAAGSTGNQIQYENFRWHHFPLIYADNSHSITKSIDPVYM